MIDYRFSILIPLWNGEQYIENCLSSLLNNNYDNYQIISIAGGDDNSFEKSLKFQERYPNKIIALEQKKGGKNKALNSSLKYVDGDIIIITDIDCIYPTYWLRKINEVFQNNKINIITGLNLPYQNRLNSLAEFTRIRSGFKLVTFPNGEIISGNKLSGGNSAFRTKIFKEKIGMFEEVSKTGDDKILGIEFNKQNEDLYFFRDIYVYTEHYSNNLKKYINHRIRWARDLFIELKWRDIPRLLFLLGIGLFKLIYPIFTIIVWLIFLSKSYLPLILLFSPWIGFYLVFILKFYFELKNKARMVNKILSTKFSFKKALKIVPLMFFIYGIINIRSFIRPKHRKWNQ